MALVIRGTAVTFDDDRRVVKNAAVYINGDTIEAVLPAGKPAPSGYTTAKTVTTDGFIYPGLIDLHNHLAYNFLPLWHAPETCRMSTVTRGRTPTTYGRDVGRPAEAMGIAAAAAALRYAEVKAIVGGVTVYPGFAADDPPVSGVDGAQHRERGVRRPRPESRPSTSR